MAAAGECRFNCFWRFIDVSGKVGYYLKGKDPNQVLDCADASKKTQ